MSLVVSFLSSGNDAKIEIENAAWHLLEFARTSRMTIMNYFLKSSQGVSSHGKPGKAMEFHFLFPGLEKSWNLTLGFGKFIKVMEMTSCGTLQFGSSFKSYTSTQRYGYIQHENKNRFYCFHQILFKLTPNYRYGVLHTPSFTLGTRLFHAISHIKGH